MLVAEPPVFFFIILNKEPLFIESLTKTLFICKTLEKNRLRKVEILYDDTYQYILYWQVTLLTLASIRATQIDVFIIALFID